MRKQLHKLTITQVKAAIRKRGKWEGYLAPSKINEAWVAGNGHFGCYVTPTSEAELDKFVEAFWVTNCDSARGYRVAYWELRR